MSIDERDDIVDLVLVHADDWSALYVNGIQTYEDNSVRDEDIFIAIKGKFVRSIKTGFDGYLEKGSYFPKFLSDINEKDFDWYTY